MSGNNHKFEEAARQLGIPSDRIGLVKRNLELKAKLKERGEALTAFGITLHELNAHEGPFLQCPRDSCAGVRKILDMTEPT